MYKIGDYIVKSMTGVCKVADITHLDMPSANKDKLYYLLLPIDDNSGRIYAPIDLIDSSTRMVMSKEDALELIKKIPFVPQMWIEDDKLRHEKYKQTVKSCNPESLVEIIKMAYLQKKNRMAQGKKNTAVDERYFKVAEKNLYSELGFVLNKSKDEIYDLIAESVRNTANA
jgi:CarD family transcriptional regulator